LHSLFVSAYSIFEHYILEFGAKIEELSESKIKIADIKSKSRGVDRTIKYLTSIHIFKSASNKNPQWDDLGKFQLIRHLIIHNGNKLNNGKSDNAHLKSFVEKFDGYLTRTGEFQIRNEEFMKSFRTTAITFTDNLASDCFELLKEIQPEEKGKNLSL
jgi:hypothetical protein